MHRLSQSSVLLLPVRSFTFPESLPEFPVPRERTMTMSVARVTEIISSSKKSFEDAIQIGISRANKTLQNVKGAWIQDQKVVVENGKITEYRVNMKVTFVLTA